jgi:hypothetical protein
MSNFLTYKQDADKPYLRWFIKDWTEVQATFTGSFKVRTTDTKVEVMVLPEHTTLDGVGGKDKLKESQAIYWDIWKKAKDGETMPYLQTLWADGLASLDPSKVYYGTFCIGCSPIELRRIQKSESPTIIGNFLEIDVNMAPGETGYDDVLKLLPDWPVASATESAGRKYISETDKLNQRLEWLKEQMTPVIGENAMKASGIIGGIAFALAEAHDKKQAGTVTVIETSLKMCQFLMK